MAQLNTSNAALYAMFNGEPKTPQSIYIWADVRDIALAHVLAIVRILDNLFFEIYL